MKLYTTPTWFSSHIIYGFLVFQQIPSLAAYTMDLPESSQRPLSTFQGSPRRARHRVDAGEPRGCFSYFQNNHQSLDYTSAATANRMLSEYSQQQLLREMLERQPKIGFEEAVEDTVKVNGCKKRKLYQPLRNGGEMQEPGKHKVFCNFEKLLS